MFISGKFSGFPLYCSSGYVISNQLNLPTGYKLTACCCTARVNTDNIDDYDYNKISTLISYSWTEQGLIKVSLTEGETKGRGRVIDYIAILNKI